jgi:hypothetical protein
MSNSFRDSRICRRKVSSVRLRRKDCSSYISCVTQHADRGANIEDSRCSLLTKYNWHHFYQQTTSSQRYCKHITIRTCTETIHLLYFTHNREASHWRFNPSQTSDIILCWTEIWGSTGKSLAQPRRKRTTDQTRDLFNILYMKLNTLLSLLL